MTDLRFRRLFDPAARDFVFGRSDDGVPVDAAGRLVVALPPAGLSFSGRLSYDNAVSRGDVIGAVSGWSGAVPVSPASRRVLFSAAVPTARPCGLKWRAADPLRAASRRIAWRTGDRLRMSGRLRWGVGDPASSQAAVCWKSAERLSTAAGLQFSAALPVSAGVRGGWQVAVIIRLTPHRISDAAAIPLPALVRVSAGAALPLPLILRRIPWGAADVPPPGRSAIIAPPVEPPWRCYTPPGGGVAHLLFDERRAPGTDILFTCGRGMPGGAIIIPALKVYIVINSASLTRVSNNLPIPVTGLSIAIDVDSAHWTWSATLPLQALEDLEPDALGELVELEAVVNGHAWRLLVERLAESERFGQASLQIGGRGIAAELSDPVYPVVSHGNPDAAAMAQQLAAAALTINGVPLGWAVDWTAADWLIPAGAWVHRGTPLDAVARIAAAAGAYVQAAPAARSLRIRPRYPLAPWDWASAAPDIVLPADAVMERGTEHALRPAYDSVYVSGEAGGVLARVKRTGFAGNTPAPMVVDALVTHADAARGRGLEVLGNTGAQRIMTLETGILPASGVIHVGSLLDWTRGPQVARGLVRSLSVSASAPSGASADPVKVRQTVRVEVHD